MERPESSSSLLWQIGGAVALVLGAAAVGYMMEGKPQTPDSQPASPSKQASSDVSPQLEGSVLAGLSGLSASSRPKKAVQSVPEKSPEKNQYAAQIAAFERDLKKAPAESPQWCDLAVKGAELYLRAKENQERAEFLLNKAFMVHHSIGTTSIPMYIKILDVMLLNGNLHKYSHFFMKVAVLIQKRLVEEEDIAELKREVYYFLRFAHQYAYESASWELCDYLYSMEKYCKASSPLFLEDYVTSLHQQGRTKYGIQLMEEYLDTLKDKKDDTNMYNIRAFTVRLAKLYFYCDRFEEAKEKLQPLPMDKDHDLVIMMEYFHVLSELKLYEAMEQIEKRIKLVPLQQAKDTKLIPRSRYLMALSTSVVKKFIMIDFLVCRALPARKEGEPEAEEFSLRKISNFYIVAEFEGADKTVEMAVKGYEFTLTSPSLPSIQNWTKLSLSIYKDSSKSELVGIHHQMIPNVMANVVRI